MTGIEPAYSAWEADVLPLNYIRTCGPARVVQPSIILAGGQPMPGDRDFEYLIECRHCGSVPAANVTFRAHRGMIILMQFIKVNGPFCRSCGLDVFRGLTSDTMLQGWWGAFSMLITPVVLLLNVAQRHRVARLASPGPPPHRAGRPSPGPGLPLFARPSAIVAVLILGLIVVVLMVVNLRAS
jgi:hypothetical protein